MFLLKVVITARPRILPITSPILLGLTPGFLSKGIDLQASGDPLFPEYFFRHNFFAMGAIVLQRSRLLSPNDDEVRMWRHPFASRFDGLAAPLISRAILYIRTPFISSYVCSSYNFSGPCKKLEYCWNYYNWRRNSSTQNYPGEYKMDLSQRMQFRCFFPVRVCKTYSAATIRNDFSTNVSCFMRTILLLHVH